MRCKNWLFLLVFVILPAGSFAAPAGTPLQGRVEAIESGAEVSLPEDVLHGGVSSSADELPANLLGRWYGSVRITQMETYSSRHPEPYCQSFIREIERYFRQGKSGQIDLQFVALPDGRTGLRSSDIYFARGLKMKLTDSRGPALVPGGINHPHTMKNVVTTLGDKRAEQTRIDAVDITDLDSRLIHRGFTEVSALYEVRAPRRIRIKLLSVDYDGEGKPLWKALMEGDATKF